MQVRMPVYPHPKSGKYYFKEYIPARLIPAYCAMVGKQIKRPQIKRRFATDSAKEAARLGHIEQGKFDALIRQLELNAHISLEDIKTVRLNLIGGGLVRTKQTIDLFLIQSLQKKVDDEIAELKRRMEKGESDEPVKPRTMKRPEMRAADYYAQLQNAARILRCCELLFTEPGYDFKTELSRSRALFEQGQLAYRDYFLNQMDSRQTVANAPVPQIAASNAPALSEAFEKWKSKNNPDPNTEKEWGLSVARLIDVMGDDLPVSLITHDHLVRYRELLMKLPARLPREMESIPLAKRVQMAEAGEFPGKATLSPGSVTKHITAIRSILSVMVDDGYIQTNVAAHKAPKKVRSRKREYYAAELHTLFHSRLYRADYTRQPEQEKNARFWLPLISLYTGARASEIGGMRVSDIHRHEGFWYFSINNYDKDKSVKTDDSKRKVPVHPVLIDCGLIEHIETLKKAGNPKLFSGTVDFSAWYGKYCNGIGLDDPNIDFHSFRRSFKQACRDAEIPEEIHDQLTGHRGNNTVGRGYGGISLYKLNEYMQRITYPGLGLSQLYINKMRYT